MSSAAVEAIESRIGRGLPEDYRSFLISRTSSYLRPEWLLRTAEPIPGGGPEEQLRALSTAQELLDRGLTGEPDEAMLMVGEIEPGGYLYINVGQQKFGQFFIRFPFQDPRFYLAAKDFDDLLDEAAQMRISRRQVALERRAFRRQTATSNPSLNPRLATAGVVSPVGASGTIVANRAYATCLRSRG